MFDLDLAIPTFDPKSFLPKNSWHQLLVIGNGFDLECGLKSKFSDFYEPRKNLLFPSVDVLEASGMNWGQWLKENKLTVWDLILERHTDSRWCDIEGAIEKWVQPSNESIAFPRDPFSRTLSLLNPQQGHSDIFFDERVREKWISYPGRKVPDLPEKNIARYFANTQPEIGDWTRTILLKALLSELHELELAFAQYLRDRLGVDASYRANAGELMLVLATQEMPSADEYEISTSLLNFNYTHPPLLQIPGRLDFVNIHGRLSGEIVFGIDGKELMDCSDVVPFTKTYRLLGLDGVKEHRLVEPMGFGPNDQSTDLIKFYGHSLSKADYSYFQTLFDTVDLYKSHTRLIFYYRKHEGSENAQERMFSAVTKLLTTYGSTMDNLDHGKNLMHKLIIEGRLFVRELPY